MLINDFLDTMNSVLNKYAPLKKVNTYKLSLDDFWYSKVNLY